MEKVKVTLAKSLIAAKPNQKATAASLGLVKIGDSIVLKNYGCAGLCKTERFSGCNLILLASDKALHKSNFNVFHHCYPLMPLHPLR